MERRDAVFRHKVHARRSRNEKRRDSEISVMRRDVKRSKSRLGCSVDNQRLVRVTVRLILQQKRRRLDVVLARGDVQRRELDLSFAELYICKIFVELS